jgi:hypothetical protein
MRPPWYPILLAAALPLLAQSASAVVLFTDDFTVTSNSQDVNQENGAGRQGGTLAGSLYNGFGTQHQVGNSTTDVGQPGGSPNSNYLLIAFSSSVQSTIDISAVATGPLTIDYDMYLRGANPGGGDDTKWGAFTLRAAGNAFPVAGSGEYGMLVRGNGGVQTFQNGNSAITPGGWDTPGFALADHWTLTFTDTAGTGSAFNGNGSQVTIVNGATTLGTITLSQLNSSGLEMGFQNFDNRFIGVDNVSVSTVPEPSAALLISVVGLAGLIRRRRA